MDYLCDKFGDFSFSRFIVQTDIITYRIREVDECYTHTTTVGVNNDNEDCYSNTTHTETDIHTDREEEKNVKQRNRTD